MSEKTTIIWLEAASLVLIAFGIVIAAAALPALSGPARLLVDIAIWPLDGAQALAGTEARLLCAISGGMLVGWGALMALVAVRLYPRDPALARTMIAVSTVTWFVVDCAASIAAGAPVNAVLNIGFLALFAVPLLFGSATGPSVAAR